MPAFSQNSYVSTPGRNTSGTPTVLAMISPKIIAHSTYSMFGRARWCALPYEAIDCSTTLPARPVTSSSTRPGTIRAARSAGDLRCAREETAVNVVTTSPRNARYDAELDQDDCSSGSEHGPPVTRDSHRSESRSATQRVALKLIAALVRGRQLDLAR